jgi:hypothetical protein
VTVSVIMWPPGSALKVSVGKSALGAGLEHGWAGKFARR